MNWIERLNLYTDPVTIGATPVDVFGWSYNARFIDNRPHSHTFFEICLVGSYGEGQFIVEGNVHPVRPGDVFIARPSVVHQIINVGKVPMELTWFCFQIPPTISDATDDADRLLARFSQSELLIVRNQESAISSIWTAIKTVFSSSGGTGNEVRLSGLVPALVIRIAQEGCVSAVVPFYANTTATSDAAVRLALRFIHDNLDRRITVGDIAAQIHCSSRHLTRLITELTGFPPARYITIARMNLAKTLLNTTDTPIKEVARSVGYEDVHHFTRAYSAMLNMTPGETRKRSRERLTESC